MHVLAALLASAMGWQGNVHFTHDPPRKSGGSDGVIHVSAGRIRIEEPTPMGLSVILFDGAHLRVLFPEQRTYMELPRKEAALATVPPFSLSGMRAIGREKIEGRTCTVWEKKNRKTGVTQRLWVPEGRMPYLTFLRTVTQTDRGATRADVTDIRFAPQPAALFRIPKGYKKQ